jgi:hypothetical protein
MTLMLHLTFKAAEGWRPYQALNSKAPRAVALAIRDRERRFAWKPGFGGESDTVALIARNTKSLKI